MRKTGLLLFSLLLSLTCNGAGNWARAEQAAQGSSPRANDEMGLSSEGKALSMTTSQTTSTDFSLKLFSEAAKAERGKNMLISPFSAYVALSMCLNGSAGSTRDQMAKAMGVTGKEVDALNERLQTALAELNSNDKVQMQVANALYADNETPFKQSFKDLCNKIYGAEVHNEAFSDPSVVKKINSWCNEKTHGKISKIIEKLLPNEKMVLLNAIYFKGAWAHQFSKAATQDDQFSTASGDKVPVKMMHETERMMYCKGDDFQSVRLNYLGNRQCMYVFLPNEGVDMPAFQARFTPESWKQWMGGYTSKKVALSFPRFKIEYSTLLNGYLEAMGMGEAFKSGVADFSNMISPPAQAWISRVLQKTYMDVNEEGTEAAAVTAVMMGARAIMARPEEPIQFRVDRPFVIALVDNDTDEILFLGSVMKP